MDKFDGCMDFSTTFFDESFIDRYETKEMIRKTVVIAVPPPKYKMMALILVFGPLYQKRPVLGDMMLIQNKRPQIIATNKAEMKKNVNMIFRGG
jgi:hypothetical protein